ncbi:MAG: Holliday junction resolvase RuvX [Cytophagales bacterium]
MGRILAIDFGYKRSGIAVTDPLKIAANALTTVDSKELILFLKNYFLKEEVESIVVGMPKKLDGTDTNATKGVNELIISLKSIFVEKQIYFYDERFTSKIAMQTMIMAGTSKKYRREKGNIDKISAVIILQDWMQSQGL